MKQTSTIRIILLLLSMHFLFADLPQGATFQTLDNGMEIVLIENPALPMMGVNVVIQTGSAYETIETSGMTHMLEHLLFNGTTSRTQRELYDDVDRIGGYNNANTGEFYTNFMMVVPAEHALAGLEIQADMLFNSIIPQDKFEKEKGIVLEEIAQSIARGSTQMEYHLNDILYHGHSLSLPTLGTYSTIENMSRDDIYHYYTNTFVPNNMRLSIIGNFETESMLKSIQSNYGKAPRRDVFRPVQSGLVSGFQAPSMTALANGSMYYRRYEGNAPTMQFVFPLKNTETKGYLNLLETVLTENINVLETMGLEKFPEQISAISYAIHASPFLDVLLVEISLINTSQNEEIISFIKNETSQMTFDASEAQAVSQSANDQSTFLRQLEKPHMFGIYNANSIATSGLNSTLDMPSDKEYEKARKVLSALKLDIQPTIIYHHPNSDSSLVVDDTALALQETANLDFYKHYSVQKKHVCLKDKIKTFFGKTLKSKSNTTGGKITTQLVNNDGQGQALIVRENPKSQLLAIHYLYKYKSTFEAKYGEKAAQILHDAFGQRMESPENIAMSEKYGLHFTVNDNPWIPMDNIYLHPDFGYIRVEGLASNLPEVLTYINTQLNTFIPTEDEYTKAYATFSNSMGRRNTDEAKDQFNKLVNANIYTKKNVIQKDGFPSYQEILAFAKEYFRPGNRIVSVVSPGSAELIKQYLGSDNDGDTPVLDVVDVSYILNEKALNAFVEAGGEQTHLFWGFMKKVEKDDIAPLSALSLLLSDKIVFEVREKQGLAYSMSARIGIQKDIALFYIKMGTRPQNAEKLAPQFPGFFTPEMLGDVSEDELTKAINMYLGRMSFRRLSSINQAYYLGESLYFTSDMNSDDAFLKALNAVTLEDVKRVARHYLVAENVISITVK
jgi:zinc protease